LSGCEVVPFSFVKTTSIFCGNYGAILYFSKSHDLTSFPARHLDIGQCPMSNVHVQCPMSNVHVQCPMSMSNVQCPCPMSVQCPSSVCPVSVQCLSSVRP